LIRGCEVWKSGEFSVIVEVRRQIMETQIAISYPAVLADSLKMESGEFEREIKTVSLVKLYELGKVSSGMASKVLGISRLAFLDVLAAYHVSCFSDADEVEADLANA
jgi:predicted HTH domain antitoxin